MNWKFLKKMIFLSHICDYFEKLCIFAVEKNQFDATFKLIIN